MKPVLVVLCLFISGNVFAQGFSAGLRTGASYWPASSANTYIIDGNNSIKWEKIAYGRYESKGRFAADLGISHNHFSYTYDTPDWTEFSPRTHEILDHRSEGNLFMANMSVQFRVTNRKSPLNSYFGAGISYGRHSERHSITLQDVATLKLSKRTETPNYGVAFCGLNNYTAYAITKHINVHSMVAFDIDPFDALSTFRPANQAPVSRLSWNIGCGYTF